MTSILTAWLVKLATRILRSQLDGLHSRIDYLDQNLDTALAEHRRQSQQLKAEAELAHSRGLQIEGLTKQVTEYKDNNLILGGQVESLQVELGKLRTDNDVLRRQLDNQAATIRNYQLEKENLYYTIDVLQTNVRGWSRVFATIEHQMGISREIAVRLRREIDVFTVRSNAAIGAGSASQASDSAGGSAGSTANGDTSR